MFYETGILPTKKSIKNKDFDYYHILKRGRKFPNIKYYQVIRLEKEYIKKGWELEGYFRYKDYIALVHCWNFYHNLTDEKLTIFWCSSRHPLCSLNRRYRLLCLCNGHTIPSKYSKLKHFEGNDSGWWLHANIEHFMDNL